MIKLQCQQVSMLYAGYAKPDFKRTGSSVFPYYRNKMNAFHMEALCQLSFLALRSVIHLNA